MKLEIKKGLTADNADYLFSQPCIKNMGDDLREVKPIKSDLVYYFSAFIDGAFAGCMMYIKHSPYEIEIHNFLLKVAMPKMKEIISHVLDFAFSQKHVMRVTANIREDFKTMYNHVKKYGLKCEGYKPCAAIKNGKPVGVYILGLTKQNWCKK